MRALLYAAAFLVLLAGCDRRDDPTVSLDSQEVRSPPGENAGSNAGSMAPAPATDATMDQSMRPAVPARCNGLTGAMLDQCIKQEDATDRASTGADSAAKGETRIP